jgi:hypothetical protein
MKHLKKKRPILTEQGVFSTGIMLLFTPPPLSGVDCHSVQVLRHPTYSTDLAPADFFLFQGLKNELIDISLDENTLKK